MAAVRAALRAALRVLSEVPAMIPDCDGGTVAVQAAHSASTGQDRHSARAGSVGSPRVGNITSV